MIDFKAFKPQVFIYNGPLTETKKLNKISEVCRTNDFFKKFVSEEGFEINPICGLWEWHIHFNRKSGFMVMMEKENYIELYVYKHEDDLEWEKIILKDFNGSDYANLKLILLIQLLYRKHIQNYRK